MTRVAVVLKELERNAMRLDRLAAMFGVEVVHAPDAAAAPGDADVLVAIGPALGDGAAAFFARANALRWVQSIGTGTDGLCGRADLAVTNVRGIHGDQMSEAAIAAMLTLARDLPRLVRNQAASRWERFAPRLLAGSTAGIVGLGAIATALAPRLRALGLTVVGFSETAGPREGFDRVEARADLASAASDLDWMIVLTPYSAATHHLIDARVLATMKPGACLINLARGGIVDEAAMLAALDGTLGGAALDVFAAEPLAEDSPLWTHPKIVVTPHLGGFHAGYADAVLDQIAANLRRYLDGGTDALLNRVQ